MNHKPWYDRLLSILPEPYRAGVFVLAAVVLGFFLEVRLRYGFDWDTTLTSYYFAFRSAPFVVVAGIYFLVKRSKVRHRYLLLDITFLLAGLIWLYYACTDFTSYKYQIDYKFSKEWKVYEPKPDFLKPMESDKRKYVESETKALERSIEPISNRIPGGVVLTVSIRDVEPDPAASEPACHLLHSRVDFAWGGPLQPEVMQLSGSKPDESGVHEWSVQRIRKHMQVVLRVAIAKTAKVDCGLMLEVKEQ